LESEGSARPIHAGVLYAGASPKIPHFDASQSARWEQKKAIAQRAATLIEDGETVLLDGGSTTYEVARLLVGRPLHLVTNSLPVANLLAADASSDLLLIGGNICPRTGVAQGPLSDRMVAALRVQKVVFSVAGIKEEGLYNNNVLLVATERAMMEAADEVIVVADSSKFGRQSLAHLCPLGAVDWLVADSGISDEWQEKVRSAGVNLLVAETGDR